MLQWHYSAKQIKFYLVQTKPCVLVLAVNAQLCCTLPTRFCPPSLSSRPPRAWQGTDFAVDEGVHEMTAMSWKLCEG